MTAPDVIALGETMAAFAPENGGDLSSAEVFTCSSAGAESNTCIGLARLGLHVAWVSRLGTDPLGDRVLAEIECAGVDVRWVVRDPARPTGVMVKDTGNGSVHYYRRGSAASALDPSDLLGVPVADARCVVVTGITALIGASPGATAHALLEEARGLRVVDPNFRSNLWGSDKAVELVRPLVALADLLLGGRGELQRLVGRADLDGENLARRCRLLGPAEVVVKRGRDGAGGLDAAGDWHEHAPAATPDVDPVGAGDAFNAGYLAVRLADGAVPEALEWGAGCGAAVAGQLGDTAGFPQEHIPR